MGAEQQDRAVDRCNAVWTGGVSWARECKGDSSQRQQASGGGARDARHTGEAGQARVLAPQGAGANETASAASPGSLGTGAVGELVKRSQMLEEALRDVLATGTNLTGYLQAKGHIEVVGMINSGSQMTPVSK